jgi:AraC-like DNA-binding protein
MVSSQRRAIFTRFSTLGEPREGRLDYWNHAMVGVYPGMKITASPEIAASWSQWSLGGVLLAEVQSQKALIQRCGTEAKCGQRTEALHFLVPKRGSFVISQGGNSASVGPGDLTILSAKEPYQIAVSEGNESLVIDCPAGELAIDPAHPLAQCLDGATPAVRMLCGFLRSLLHQGWSEAPEQDDLDALGQALVKLVGRCLGLRPQDPSEECAGVRERVLSFVAKNISDSGLRTAMIAQALSLSPRSVQMVFAAMATTPTAFILSKRLAAAAEVLERGDDFGSITDLAFDLGFNDSGYFARRFKMHFGVSPCEYRHLKHN